MVKIKEVKYIYFTNDGSIKNIIKAEIIKKNSEVKLGNAYL